MAIIKSAKKRIKSSANKHVFNLRRVREMRERVKLFTKTVESGEKKEAETQVSALYKAIDKAVKRGIIKKNTGARKKSRLMKSLAKESV